MLLSFEGLFGQHVAKKPKMMRQSIENSFENVGSVGGFVPSPVASQMSNMSNPNQIMKMLSGRDQGRRAKTFKVLVYGRICCSVSICFCLLE